ncbi:MAG: HAD family hydrolase [Planctomycetes bacterium SM23_32]|nr:MAG: HAD family hydrolase [Planctomycetes bacterium SM23_32]
MPESGEYYRMTVREALEALGTSEKGLPRKEAGRRLAEHGPNELQAGVRVPKWLMFLKQFKEVLVMVLIVAGVVSYGIGIIQGSMSNIRDGSVMFVIVVINAVIGFVQQYKAERILERLRDLIKSPARVVTDGELVEVPQRELVPGDVIQLEEGDKIPADVRVIESFNLRTNDFSLTGESMPQDKSSNAIRKQVPLADRDNMAYVGTTVASGNAQGVVTATGMATELGKIADMTQETAETKSPLQRELEVLAYRLTAIVVVISAALFVVALWQGFSFVMSMTYALVVAVACVPQALPAQVTVALSTASKRRADRKAVVKNLPSVETLGSTTVISTDKTGTLTKNEMTVRRVWFNAKEYEATGIGYEPEGDLLGPDGKPLDREQIDEIEIMMDAATMASNAEIHAPDDEHPGWYPVGDPTEAALITLSTKLGTRSPTEDEENPELHEFPFDAERKRMSSVRQFGEREVLTMKGATEGVLSISKSIYRDGEAVAITEEDKEQVRSANERYSEQAMRVLAIAYRPLEPNGEDYVLEEVEKDVIFLGLMGMIDPPKEGVREAVQMTHDAQIRTFIMTGDHARTAQAVGREIGLSGTRRDSPVITGQQMKEMSDPQLTEVMETYESLIFSRVDPADKLRIVKLLEGQGEIVAVTGDGVNDAPALKRAHIGVAMGQTGTDVAKEAAELVLLDDSFPTLVHAVQEGRTIYDNLRKTVLASMTSNGAELALVLLGLAGVALKNWAIPILAIQILAVDLLAEIMPLTFLAFDPPSDDLMRRPPRSQTEHILNLPSSAEVIFLGLLIGVLGFANFGLYMLRNDVELTVDAVTGGPAAAHYARATTLAYLTIAYCQFVNIMSRRTDDATLFRRDFFTNRILLGSIVASIGMVFVGVYGPYVSRFLAFAGPSLTDWLYVWGAALVFLGAWEVLKLLKRTRRARRRRPGRAT